MKKRTMEKKMMLTFGTGILLLCALTSCSVTVSEKSGGLVLYEETSGADQTQEEQADKDQAKKDQIPFKHMPEIEEYRMPVEVFDDLLKEEAAALIDPAICKAIATVMVMKDDRHSMVTYPFIEDANGYMDSLSQEQRDLLQQIAKKAKAGESFQIKEKDYGKALITDTLTTSSTLRLCEPELSCCFEIDLISERDGISDLYFDPRKNANYSVKKGKADEETIRHDMELMRAVIERIVRKMPEDLSAYDQYFYLAAVLGNHITYDKEPENRYTAYGALVDKRCVCEGYASAYLLLCKEADLWCAYRHGMSGDESHIWNMIKLETGIFNVDVTWCDNGEPGTKRWYENFVRSDEDFEWNGHEIDDHMLLVNKIIGTGEFEPNPYEDGR